MLSNTPLKILLVEPDYPNKFPPLGLLKIGTYHKQRGDMVSFVKGFIKKEKRFCFDRVYISTLFSFYHEKTINTILYYKKLLNGDIRKIFVGGIYSSLNPMIIFNETGVYPIVGLLDKHGILGNDKVIIDSLTPAYDLLDQVDYEYGLKDTYIGYTTRGCPNHCPFCAVPRLEPIFIEYIDIKPYIKNIKDLYGEKNNLVLMDNNVLASRYLRKIIDDLKSLGFERDGKIKGRKRTVDFNQGIDVRYVNSKTAGMLSEICAEPIRLAYDHVNIRKVFERGVMALRGLGIKDLSTYMLYNYMDTPKDLYIRLRHVVDLNKELDTKIYSFPMRYTPLDAQNRKHVGAGWTPKQIRGLQCILNVTKGLVSHREDFFMKAFGENPEEFEEIILMPDDYILQRYKYENNGAFEWKTIFKHLTTRQKNDFHEIVGTNDQIRIRERYASSKSIRIKKILEHYIEGKR